MMRRRKFLTSAGAAVCGGALANESRADDSRPSPCAASAWQKHGIVARHQGGPQGGWIQNFTSVSTPLDGGDRWRLWSSVSGPGMPFNIGFAEGVPGEPMAQTLAQLSPGEPAEGAALAIGNLPEGWRPVQPVYVSLPDGRHRLYFWAHAKGVVRYLAADSDDGRAYRVIDPLRPCLYHPNDRAVDGKVAVEAGLGRRADRVAKPEKGEPLAPARLVSNDATNLYRLPDGSFEMYSVGLLEVAKDSPRFIAHDNAAGWIRVIDRYTSEDGLDWTDRSRILVPDDSDPKDQQFYYLSVTHTDRGRVGVLGHYRVEEQSMDMEWCFSKDGIDWQREHRRPWLSRGARNEIDSYQVYAGHSVVRHQGKWWLFYTGLNTSHNHQTSYGEPQRAIFLATCDDIWA